MQKLYAAGFNAWGQLRFDAQTEDEPDDIAVFTQVLETRAISHVQPSLSCTTGNFERHDLFFFFFFFFAWTTIY